MCVAKSYFGRIQGGEAGESPPWALTAEPTPESVKIAVAQRVAHLFVFGGVTLPFRDRCGYRNGRTPSQKQKSVATPYIVVFQHPVRKDDRFSELLIANSSILNRTGRSDWNRTNISRLMKPAHLLLCYRANALRFVLLTQDIRTLKFMACHERAIASRMVAGLRLAQRFPGYEPGVSYFTTLRKTKWCGTRELHPHDLFGRQAC